MSPTEQLVAVEQIKRLKARYFRCMDTRDWSGFGDTFCAGGLLEVESIRRSPDGGTPVSKRETGREAIVGWVSGVLAGAITIHHGHTPEIDILSPESATGIWAMEDRVIWASRSLHGWGHYHEIYAIEDGEWRIASSRLSRLRVDISPAAMPHDPGQPQMLDIIAQGG